MLTAGDHRTTSPPHVLRVRVSIRKSGVVRRACWGGTGVHRSVSWRLILSLGLFYTTSCLSVYLAERSVRSLFGGPSRLFFRRSSRGSSSDQTLQSLVEASSPTRADPCPLLNYVKEAGRCSSCRMSQDLQNNNGWITQFPVQCVLSTENAVSYYCSQLQLATAVLDLIVLQNSSRYDTTKTQLHNTSRSKKAGCRYSAQGR